jgi:hypothetical protein
VSLQELEAGRELLTRLLDTYERSMYFKHPGPWRTAVRVQLNEKTFPEAFAPEGRDRLAQLRAAALRLEQQGALTTVRARGGLYQDPEPKEVRLSPERVARAYMLAADFGYTPLAWVLEALAAHARGLSASARSEWMRTFLNHLGHELPTGAVSRICSKREQLKQLKHEWEDVRDALTAAVALDWGAQGWERVVSERLFSDSKRLAAIRSWVAELLRRVDPRWEEVTRLEPQEVLEAYGIRRRPGLLRCAGRAWLHVHERVYQLADFAPSAHLPEAWADAWLAGVTAEPSLRIVTTVENEYPFLAYVEEAGGPQGLGERGELVVYTGGFPPPWLVSTLAALARSRQDLHLRHWGDADAGGLQIWWYLRRALVRGIEPFRTTAEWVQQTSRGAQPLEAADRRALERFQALLTSSPVASEVDVRTALSLCHRLLTLGIKVEQERY